ncbi:MAG: hypothetical protein WAO55_13185 [Candidatus Manganitrophaceae bacterium]
MKIQTVWAVKVVPDDENDHLHEFALSWYRFTSDSTETDPVIKLPAQPAVWVKFSKVDQLEKMQSSFPEAKLGPASSFTEAILFAESGKAAGALRERVETLLRDEEGPDLLGEILKEEMIDGD